MLDYQVLERVGCRSLLGIRFWDPAEDVQVRDGLRVTLAPLENTDKVINAFRTRGGIYAFHNIPGMHDLETDLGTSLDEAALASPAVTAAFKLEVEDPTGQFTSVAQVVNLPLSYRGLFLVDDDSGSPADRPKGFNLYSAITRAAPAQHVFVRGELVDATTSLPAANALVRVDTDDNTSWYGLSDEEGKFAVMMPYPFLHIAYGSSPPVNDGVRLFERTWNITLTVSYAPSMLEPVPGTDRSGYASILGQAPALVYLHSPGTPAGEGTELTTQLNYGRDLVVSTDGFSELYVSPTGSPA